MNIALIAVKPEHSSYGLFSIAPLGLVYLGTILKQQGHEVRIYDEARANVFKRRKNKLDKELLKSDFIGLSVISPAANRALDMLKSIRRVKPNIRTAVGGPHMLGIKQAREFARYADVVVQKEAENIIDSIIKGKLKGIVEGSLVRGLDRLPIPDLHLLQNTKKKILDFFKLTPISSSRGCPRDCEFCAVSNIHGKRIRYRSADSVMQELQKRLEEGYKRIFFTDDNFSVHPSKRIPLLEAMKAENEKGNWFESLIIQDEVPGILKGGDNYVNLLKDAGIKTVMLGIESFNDEKLKALQKTHKTTDSEKAIRLLRKHNLLIYAFGMAKPEIDDKESIRHQFRKMKEEGITFGDMTIETPIPGTDYWEKYKNKLTALKNGSPDWDKWTFQKTVIPTQNMSQRAFQREIKKNMRWFYSPMRALKLLLKGNVRRSLTIFYVWLHIGKMYG